MEYQFKTHDKVFFLNLNINPLNNNIIEFGYYIASGIGFSSFINLSKISNKIKINLFPSDHEEAIEYFNKILSLRSFI